MRRVSRIRTIRGLLAIEENTLTEEQVATLLDGKPVIRPLREIEEARNAIKAYDRYGAWTPGSEGDLLCAHAVLMAGLLDSTRPLPPRAVGVGGPGVVHHVAPRAARVPLLMANLLRWVRSTDDHPSPGLPEEETLRTNPAMVEDPGPGVCRRRSKCSRRTAPIDPSIFSIPANAPR